MRSAVRANELPKRSRLIPPADPGRPPQNQPQTAADGGTLFLDEIGERHQADQAHLVEGSSARPPHGTSGSPRCVRTWLTILLLTKRRAIPCATFA